jgi:hypothetical protein
MSRLAAAIAASRADVAFPARLERTIADHRDILARLGK